MKRFLLVSSCLFLTISTRANDRAKILLGSEANELTVWDHTPKLSEAFHLLNQGITIFSLWNKLAQSISFPLSILTCSSKLCPQLNNIWIHRELFLFLNLLIQSIMFHFLNGAIVPIYRGKTCPVRTFGLGGLLGMTPWTEKISGYPMFWLS